MWKNEVENALRVFHYNVLEGKGKISNKQAKEKAESEYEKFKIIQDNRSEERRVGKECG